MRDLVNFPLAMQAPPGVEASLPRDIAALIAAHGALAQLGERYNGIVEVSGSIPLGSTIFDNGKQSGGLYPVENSKRSAGCLGAALLMLLRYFSTPPHSQNRSRRACRRAVFVFRRIRPLAATSFDRLRKNGCGDRAGPRHSCIL